MLDDFRVSTHTDTGKRAELSIPGFTSSPASTRRNAASLTVFARPAIVVRPGENHKQEETYMQQRVIVHHPPEFCE
jgi:hypothetical protein